MATPLVVGTNYFIDFVLGTTGDPRDFLDFDARLKENFQSIQTVTDQLIAEVQALSGPNQILAQDILFPDSVISTEDGRLGIESYVVTGAPTTSVITISAGIATVSGLRVSNGSSTAINVASFTNGTGRVIYVDSNGVVIGADTDPGNVLVLYTVDVSGGAFTLASIENQAPTFIDGDEWVRQRTTHANSLFPTSDDPYADASTPYWLSPSRRIDSLELLLSGRSSNPDLPAPGTLPQMVIPGGSAAAPGLALGNGTGTNDLDSGIYRSGTDELSVATAGNARLRVQSNGIVDLDAQPAGHARRTAAQTGITTETAISFNQADVFDRASQHDHTGAPTDLDIATGQEGIYLVTVWTTFDESTAAGATLDRHLSIYEGSTQRARQQVVGSGTDDVSASVSVLLNITAATTIQARVQSGESVSIIDSGMSWAKVA